MDWDNSSQVLQAIFWVCMFFCFAHGYIAGNRL